MHTEGRFTMDQIDVIWKSYREPEIIARGYWDQAIVEDLFNHQNKDYNFTHHTRFDDLSYGEDMDNPGAVVVINGRTHVEDIEKINTAIAKLRWCLLIITGDEEGLFPWQDIKHPLLRTWVQLPRMNVHNDVSQKLPNGPRPGTRQILKEIGLQEKTQDWFFAGQINHDRREQCIEQLRYLKDSGESPNGTFIETHAFGEEKLGQQQYIHNMAISKIVLCPSGIETPDTFRLYEALEAGCLPVVDAFATRNQSYGFWQYLFDEEVPFPIVDYWDKLPELMPELLRDFPHNANKAFAWWQNKKRNLGIKLINDIREINV